MKSKNETAVNLSGVFYAKNGFHDELFEGDIPFVCSHCEYCSKELEDWTVTYALKDDETGIITTMQFCSHECYHFWTKEGIRVVSEVIQKFGTKYNIIRYKEVRKWKNRI